MFRASVVPGVPDVRVAPLFYLANKGQSESTVKTVTVPPPSFVYTSNTISLYSVTQKWSLAPTTSVPKHAW